MLAKKIKIHLWTLPRWFAAPFFGASVLLAAQVSGGINLNAFLALIATLLVMAGGHSFNSFLDYVWTGLDKGKKEDRSAEKSYTGGQNLIENGDVSLAGVFINAIGWYLLSAIPMGILISRTGNAIILVPYILGMLMTFWYSKSKFNWTHELCLGVGCGVLPALIGAFAVNSSPPILQAVLTSIPVMIILSFAGLALDEFPDAESNLKKGVKSLAYMVWKWSDWSQEVITAKLTIDHQDYPPFTVPQWRKSYSTLRLYLTAWLLFMVTIHVFLISIGYLYPLTGLAFLAVPGFIACMVMLPANFDKTAKWFVIIGALYPILLVLGQAVG
jgi:hypothetical protein